MPNSIKSSCVRGVWPVWIALWLCIFLSRLPFLSAGFGWDEDAWGNVVAASRLSETGRYEPPRPPGFPVVQFAQSLLWRGGPLRVNGATAMMSAFAGTGFALLASSLGIALGPAVAAGLALVFIPVVYVNSSNAMDYVWALAFIVWGFVFAARGRAAWAGLFLGLAIGCRISSILFLLPLACFFHCTCSLRKSFFTLLVAVLCAGLCFYPAWSQSGLAFLTFSDQPFRVFLPFLLHNSTVGIWGVVGSLSIAAAVLLAVFRPDPDGCVANASFPRGSLLRVALMAVALVLALFLWLPAESAYLIPAIPFVLLLLLIRLRPGWFYATAIMLGLSSFLLWVPVDHEGLAPAPAIARMLPATVRWRAAMAHWGRPTWQGPILYTHRQRARQMEARDAAVRTIAELPARPVLVQAGSYSDFFLADYTVREALPPGEVSFGDSTNAPALVYTVRGFRNCPALGFCRMPAAGREEFLRMDWFPAPTVGGAGFSVLDVALANTIVQMRDQPSVEEAMARTEFRMPFLRSGVDPTPQPFLVQYRGKTGLPLFDTDQRAEVLRPWYEWLEYRRVTGHDLLNGAVPAGLLFVNPGCPTEFELPLAP